MFKVRIYTLKYQDIHVTVQGLISTDFRLVYKDMYLHL